MRPTSSPTARSIPAERPRDKPFFLMMHHKALDRPWSRPTRTRRVRDGNSEPVTLWDSYATRTDALHENQQRVAADLTNAT
jgi:hypothetical protein